MKGRLFCFTWVLETFYIVVNPVFKANFKNEARGKLSLKMNLDCQIIFLQGTVSNWDILQNSSRVVQLMGHNFVTLTLGKSLVIVHLQFVWYLLLSCGSEIF